MEALYHQTNKLIQEIQSGFVRLERANDENAHEIENEIQIRIDQITSNCERLDILVNKEPVTRRATAKMRVDQLKYDCRHLQAALRNVQHKRYTRDRECRDREELMSRTFRPNDEDTSILIDHALQHNTQLHGAHRGMDDLINSGSAVLSSLRDQRGNLKGVQKRMLDVANYLGMSNTVMRFIERRSHQDKYILYGGMFVTCLFMFLVYKYLT